MLFLVNPSRPGVWCFETRSLLFLHQAMGDDADGAGAEAAAALALLNSHQPLVAPAAVANRRAKLEKWLKKVAADGGGGGGAHNQ